MSRALDKETAAALQKGDPEAAYNAIADVLTEQQQEEEGGGETPARLEIEFLGREHLPLPEENRHVLRDGNAVAIPKLALVQAFFAARKILQRHRSDRGETRVLLRATAVILLMDPEHLTAANTRKRILQEQVKSGPSPRTAAALAKEGRLVDSLLTSHLHRHTKSPTLWNHRRWLVSVASGLADGSSSSSTVGSPPAAADALRGITDVVMVAAVRHPRNYYAWDHARWLVQHHQQQRIQQAAGGAAEDDGAQAAARLAVAVRDWCYRHHTDTSGWSFLFSLLAAASASSTPSGMALYAETVGQVEHLATSLRWTGEAAWVFLRTAVAYQQVHASGLLPHHAAEDDAPFLYDRFLAAASSLRSRVDPASHESAVLQRAQDWCARAVAGSHGPSAGEGCP